MVCSSAPRTAKMSKRRSRCSSSALLALSIALASGSQAAAAAGAGAGAGAFVGTCRGSGAHALVSRSARTARAARTRRPGEGGFKSAGDGPREWACVAGACRRKLGGGRHVCWLPQLLSASRAGVGVVHAKQSQASVQVTLLLSGYSSRCFHDVAQLHHPAALSQLLVSFFLDWKG